jgi:hypothetical protein
VLGAGVGFALRDNGQALANERPAPAVKAQIDKLPAVPQAAAKPRSEGKREEVVRLDDGSRQVTFYNEDGSRGMRIIYAPTYRGTNSSSPAPSSGVRPASGSC